MSVFIGRLRKALHPAKRSKKNMAAGHGSRFQKVLGEGILPVYFNIVFCLNFWSWDCL